MATYAEPVFERRTAVRRKNEVVTDRWSFMAPLGRALLSAIFILYGFPHFTAPTIGYAAHHGDTASHRGYQWMSPVSRETKALRLR